MGIRARSARHTNLRVSMSVPLSILYLLIINLMEFFKVWAKHNFYYIRYISVYIQPRYFYLIFRSVNGNNMNRVILHSVRPSFWKKRDFSHAPGCGSTESGCEISVPWWLILADRGKMTSVWSRDRDTGDTSEGRYKTHDPRENITRVGWCAGRYNFSHGIVFLSHTNIYSQSRPGLVQFRR